MPKRNHKSEIAAIAEAQHLAEQHPNLYFFVLQSVHCFVAETNLVEAGMADAETIRMNKEINTKLFSQPTKEKIYGEY